jgi:enamine deaminase RidA (YjgF/YER057c/UK114 family)
LSSDGPDSEGVSEGVSERVRRLAGDPPSPWEEAFRFSRAIRAGGLVLVGGTTSVGDQGTVRGDTPYAQTVEIVRKLAHELGRAGASLTDVVQTRVYVTDISRAEEVGRAHAEAFGDVRPLMTMVEVSALIDPRMLVEIEAMAVVGGRVG